MRYFILLLLAAALCLPAVAGTAPTSQHKSSGKQWALFSKKNHAQKAKKENKAKRSKKAGKSKRGAKSKH
jgi:hypothetical protein